MLKIHFSPPPMRSFYFSPNTFNWSPNTAFWFFYLSDEDRDIGKKQCLGTSWMAAALQLVPSPFGSVCLIRKWKYFEWHNICFFLQLKWGTHWSNTQQMVRLWTGLRSCTLKANYLRKGLNMKPRYFSKKILRKTKKWWRRNFWGWYKNETM